MTHKIDNGPSPVRAPETSSSATARAGSERGQPVAAVAPADSVRLTGEAEDLQALGRKLAGAPASIDVARVNAVRNAIAEGTYRISPQEIAARLLELESGLGR